MQFVRAYLAGEYSETIYATKKTGRVVYKTALRIKAWGVGS